VGVDVTHLGLLDTGLGEGAVEAEREALPFLVLAGDVVGVAGGAVTGELAIDAGAAGLGVFEGLDHEDTGAFAHDETIARGVKRFAHQGAG